MNDDPDASIKQYFNANKNELRCCVCGKRGIEYFPTGPNDTLNQEHGGWCSLECFEAETGGHD